MFWLTSILLHQVILLTLPLNNKSTLKTLSFLFLTKKIVVASATAHHSSQYNLESCVYLLCKKGQSPDLYAYLVGLLAGYNTREVSTP